MREINFSKIARKYEQDSLVQRSAADLLIELVAIDKDDDVLDLGCGAGHLTRKLRELTNGDVVGIDPATGMIDEAIKNRGSLDIKYMFGTAETLEYDQRFDIVFCNSTFQWVSKPDIAVPNCYRALRKGGRIGIQAPATSLYCPNFVKAIDRVKSDPLTRDTFMQFNSPWLFLETAKEYSTLFEHAGFSVPFAQIVEICTAYAPDVVLKIFESGAAAGYLNSDYCGIPIEQSYTDAFRTVLEDSIYSQANRDNLVELVFRRIYLLAVKE